MLVLANYDIPIWVEVKLLASEPSAMNSHIVWAFLTCTTPLTAETMVWEAGI